VGATKEEAGFDIQVTEKGTSQLYETAIKFIPTLRESKRETAWAGLRPCTPDRGPILGAAPNWENVTLAKRRRSTAHSHQSDSRFGQWRAKCFQISLTT
jgi:glycine/D-amino acid oxidase-like deaminating enzyme